jgi:hypothetical protein
MTKHIASHARPDLDAVASTALAELWLFENESVIVHFVPKPVLLANWSQWDAVLDTGKVYDKATLRFDHKGPGTPFVGRNEHCATSLVWDYLLELGRDVAHLRDIVQVVRLGDANSRSPAVLSSRTMGPHLVLQRAFQNTSSDLHAYKAWLRWFKQYEQRLKEDPKAQYLSDHDRLTFGTPTEQIEQSSE